jgi:citrate lyase subunit beta/citryl-CoA lyase
MLFVPGNQPGMIQSASVLGADSVILDLEDAISLGEKDSARKLVSKALNIWSFKNTEVTVRINPIFSSFGLVDLKLMLDVEPDALVIPKSEVESMKTVAGIINEFEAHQGKQVKTKLLAIIESASGVEHINEILKTSPRIIGVMFGGEDYTSDMGISRTSGGQEIEYARNRIAIACKVQGIDAIDTPFTDVDDHENLYLDACKAKDLGFSGKAAINPRQISVIHRAFTPEKAQIQYALRVLDAMSLAEKEGKGVFSLDGRMVDAPIIQRARRTVNLAQKLGLVKEGSLLR